jgi:hypothetical protein
MAKDEPEFAFLRRIPSLGVRVINDAFRATPASKWFLKRFN